LNEEGEELSGREGRLAVCGFGRSVLLKRWEILQESLNRKQRGQNFYDAKVIETI
jgi:hypothetical protein